MSERITIAEARRMRNVTQTEAAKHLGISLNAYRNKESGKSKFFVDEAYSMCQLLLFSVSRQVANRIYNQADQIDSQMRFRAYPNKVRMQSVLAAQEISMDMLMEQIKKADALAQQSAE